MPRFNVLLKIRKRVGGLVRADELWVESEGETGLAAMESARLAYLPMGDPRVSPPVSVHGCVPFPAEYQLQVGKTLGGDEGGLRPVQPSGAVSRETEVFHAQQVSQAAPVHGGGGAQPVVCEESGNLAVRGKGVQLGGQKRKGGRPKGSRNKAKAVVLPTLRDKSRESAAAAVAEAGRLDPRLMPRDDPPTPTPAVIPPQPVRPRVAGETAEPPGLREAVEAAIEADLSR